MNTAERQQRNVMIARLYAAGWSVAAISRAVNLTRRHVRWILNEAGDQPGNSSPTLTARPRHGPLTPQERRRRAREILAELEGHFRVVTEIAANNSQSMRELLWVELEGQDFLELAREMEQLIEMRESREGEGGVGTSAPLRMQ